MRTWKTGEPPKSLKEDRVLVIGPDEMWDSDYPFVKKALDDATLKVEHFSVVLIGHGNRYVTKGRDKVYYGIDHLTRRWAESYMLTCRLVHGHDSYKAAVKDVIDNLGDDPYLVYFDDGEDEDAPRFYESARPYVRKGRVKVIRA